MSIDQTSIDALRAALPAETWREISPSYLEEPRDRLAGRASALLCPGSTEEVATILRHCNAAKLPVVPYGGGTGLVGGQVAPSGPPPILVSLERMDRVRAVYPEENVMVVEAGVILQSVQDAARAANRLFPLSLASQGSARIGGCLSTNAGGLNVLRYGNTRDLCLGLEVVFPNGEIWNGLSRLRKDNTGYDLRHLMIGAEGTLGIITAATLKLFPIPRATTTALFAVRDPSAALDLLNRAQGRIGPQISAFELMHRQSPDFLTEVGPETRLPLDPWPEWSVLIELGLSQDQDPQSEIEALFVEASEAGEVHDGVIASSQAQSADLWAIRERIPEANRRIGAVLSTDISLPLGRIAEFIARAPQELARLGTYRINCFGHLGDGNLHYNIFPVPGEKRAAYDGQKDEIQRCIHDLVNQMEGSISAEHGIGRIKAADLRRYADPAKMAAITAIKHALDPNGIMNPGAILEA